MSYGCYQCHGYEAQGSNATGPRLGPRPIAFAAFSRYVRQPTNQMPPYTTKVVSDADLANIYAFVQARPTPPQNDSAAEIAEAGRRLRHAHVVDLQIVERGRRVDRWTPVQSESRPGDEIAVA